MKTADRYLRIVEWSEEDQCYVGRCPELMLGGVHGLDEREVFAELCDVIEEWVSIADQDGEQLPPGTAGKKYSGRFNLRLEPRLHERLSIEALKDGKSLNAYCSELLRSKVDV